MKKACYWTASSFKSTFLFFVLVLFVDKFKGHFNCCILAAGKNTHSDTCEQGLDMMGFDVVGALWGVEDNKEEGG